MPRKLNRKLGIVTLLASSLLIAGCSSSVSVDEETRGTPTWGSNKIIENVNTKDNTLADIYETLADSSSANSNIVNSMLTKIAEDIYGTYSELLTISKKEYNSQDVIDFIAKHEAYNYTDNVKVIKKTDGTYEKSTYTEDEMKQIRFAKVNAQLQDLQTRVKKALFDEIKGGSYSDRNRFYESRYVASLKKQMYTVTLPSGLVLHEGVLITPDHQEDVVDTYYLHIQEGLYDDYVAKKIIPEIYRDYLVQRYIETERSNILGRTYAREVNMITVSTDSSNKIQVQKLFNNFYNKYIKTKTNNVNFELIAKAMRGIDLATDADKTAVIELLDESGFTKMKYPGTDTPLKFPLNTPAEEQYDVYEETKLGQIVKKLLKLYEATGIVGGQQVFVPVNRINADSETLSDFTNNYAYTVETGVEMKLDEIRITDYIKDGWYLKNGGLTDLPTAIRDRLFNIGVSNIIDYPNHEYEQTDYVQYFGDNAYLTSDKSEAASDNNIVITDSGNFYIIQVNEAVSTSKLSTDVNNEYSYRYLKSDSTGSTESALNTWAVAKKVVEASSSKDTYKTSANQYYLMLSNILYYDEVVYDYFKSNYADLFK